MAKRGNLGAAKLLFEWVLGAPPAPVDPDRLDEHELSVRRGRPTTFDKLLLACDHDEEPSLATEEAETVSWQAPETAPAQLDQQIKALWSSLLRRLDRGHNGAPARGPLMSAAEAHGDDTVAQATALPETRDAVVGWETFAESRLEWGEGWAAPVELLWTRYSRWCAAHGLLALAESDVLKWLEQHGATVVRSHVEGVRVLD